MGSFMLAFKAGVILIGDLETTSWLTYDVKVENVFKQSKTDLKKEDVVTFI